jgi:hypothetical protein
MDSDTGIADKSKARAKAIAAIPMAGILVTAALVSGLAFVGSNLEMVMAQTTTGGGTSTGGTTGGGVGGTTGGGTSTGGTSEGGGTTGGGAMAGGNASTSTVRMHLQEAMTAAQSGNMQGVMMHLRLALDSLGNMSSTGGGGGTTGGGGGTTSGLTAPGTTGGSSSGGGGG